MNEILLEVEKNHGLFENKGPHFTVYIYMSNTITCLEKITTSQVIPTYKQKKKRKKKRRSNKLTEKKNEVSCNVLGFLCLILPFPKPPFTRSDISIIFLIELRLTQTSMV